MRRCHRRANYLSPTAINRIRFGVAVTAVFGSLALIGGKIRNQKIESTSWSSKCAFFKVELKVVALHVSPTTAVEEGTKLSPATVCDLKSEVGEEFRHHVEIARRNGDEGQRHN